MSKEEEEEEGYLVKTSCSFAQALLLLHAVQRKLESVCCLLPYTCMQAGLTFVSLTLDNFAVL
jgi:hypothetical protein